MSLKDDFLEALNSVKRDITRDEEQLPSAAAPESKAEEAADIVEAVFSAPISPAEDHPSDDIIFEAFQQAAELDAQDTQYDEDDEPADSGLHLDSYLPAPPRSFESAPVPQPVEEPYVDPQPETHHAEGDPSDFYSDDKTVISRHTVIRGTLQTEDSVRLLGQIMGDIECRSNIVIAGKVRGNTSAANAFIMDAQVDGSVYCDDAISISSDAWILGNVRAGQADIDGKVKGNLEVRNSVSIGSTSSVLGNISTDELEIKRGAFINGQIMMYTPSRDVIDRFDHFER